MAFDYDAPVKEEGKICPFAVARDCYKEKCAIWDEEAEACAILSLVWSIS